jgi:DNA-binding transcriptional LysR family regulator
VLTVGATSGPAARLIARTVAELKEQRPRLDIRVLGHTDEEIVSLRLEGKVDVGVGNFGRSVQSSALHYEALRVDELRLIARRDHALAHNPRFLEQCAWILPPKATPARQLIDKELASRGVRVLNVIECACPSVTLQLLRETQAITMLPESAVSDEMLTDLLVRMPFKTGRPTSTFGILSRGDRPLSAPATDFVQCLHEMAEIQRPAKPGRPLSRRLIAQSHVG